MTDRNSHLILDNWNLVRERALTVHWTLFGKDDVLNTLASAEERSGREGI